MDANFSKLIRIFIGTIGVCVMIYGLLSDRKWILLGLTLSGAGLISTRFFKKLPATKMMRLKRT